jgi:hypothetical protein
MYGRRQTALTVAAAGFFLLAGCTGLAAGTGSASHDAAASRPAAVTAANQPATAANQPGSPPAGSRAEALALAGRMLTRLVAPPGAQPVNPSPVPGPVDVSSAGGPAPYSVDTYRFFLVREPTATVHSFLLAHVPAGMRWAGAGLAPGTTNQVTVQWVGYSPRSLPAGIAAAELGTAAMPSAHDVLIRVDAGVTWSPPRTAAERLTAASFRSVTVAETTQLPKQRTVTRVFTSRAVIGRLVALVDAMPVSPAQDTRGMSCLAVVTVYRLTFTPGVVVLAGGCGGDQVIVNGKEQPRLEDLQGALPGTVRQLLSPGLKA